MRTARRLLLATLLVAALAPACSSGKSAKPGSTGPTVTAGTDRVGMLAAAPQRGDGSSVLVDRVVLPAGTDGFVGVYADGNGAPGRLLGVSDKLPAGASTSVRVKVSPTLKGTVELHLILHADDDGNGKFEAPAHDRAVTTAGGIITTKLRYEAPS